MSLEAERRVGDYPTVQQAADVAATTITALTVMDCEPCLAAEGVNCIEIMNYPAIGAHVADALAAAGLLAVPTPALTPEQTDVIEAAIGETEVERVLQRLRLRYGWGSSETEAYEDDVVAQKRVNRAAAVDRLTAATDRNEP